MGASQVLQGRHPGPELSSQAWGTGSAQTRLPATFPGKHLLLFQTLRRAGAGSVGNSVNQLLSAYPICSELSKIKVWSPFFPRNLYEARFSKDDCERRTGGGSRQRLAGPHHAGQGQCVCNPGHIQCPAPAPALARPHPPQPAALSSLCFSSHPRLVHPGGGNVT